MTNDLIKAAEAITDKFMDWSWTFDGDEPEDLARAVLRSLLTVSDEVVEAGKRVILADRLTNDTGIISMPAERVFTAMINAILGEEK